jgi:uncharacterized protein (DUF1697 family)
MATYVALIRGVNNIGKARRVAMADLRAVFEGLGFRGVRTLLNSGNVVFSAPGERREGARTRIQDGLRSELGLASRVTLLSAREVAAAVRDNPFAGGATNPSRLLVVAPATSSDLRLLRPLLEQRWKPEALALGTRVAWLWCARGVARSPLWAAVDRALLRTGTARNLATFTKAMALARGRSA